MRRRTEKPRRKNCRPRGSPGTGVAGRQREERELANRGMEAQKSKISPIGIPGEGGKGVVVEEETKKLRIED